MRKVSGLVLLGVSVFFLVTALLGWFYAPGSTQRTPLDTNSTTELSGTATYLGTGPATVRAQSKNVVNGGKSDGSVAAWTSNTCLWWSDQASQCPSGDADNSALISADTDVFATDRHTGLSVNKAAYGTGGGDHEGLVNKWPFNTERKTYPYWDGVLGRAVDAKYQQDTTVDGMAVYQFNVKIDEEPAEIAAGAQGTYSDDKTFLVEPVTGTIIKQSETQTRTLDSGDKALEMDLAFTDDQVSKNVKDTQKNVDKLSLVGKIPWISIVLALLAGAGAALLLRGEGGRTAAHGAGSPRPSREGADDPGRPDDAEATVPRQPQAQEQGSRRSKESTDRLDLFDR